MRHLGLISFLLSDGEEEDSLLTCADPVGSIIPALRL